jgi:hypothetical protein
MLLMVFRYIIPEWRWDPRVSVGLQSKQNYESSADGLKMPIVDCDIARFFNGGRNTCKISLAMSDDVSQ